MAPDFGAWLLRSKSENDEKSTVYVSGAVIASFSPVQRIGCQRGQSSGNDVMR
jgi:hypothetical protein